jgi:hypothetical protein
MSLPDWTGATIVIVGTGPSLTKDQVEACRVAGVLVVIGRALALAPDADVVVWSGGFTPPPPVPDSMPKLYWLPCLNPVPGAQPLLDFADQPPPLPFHDADSLALSVRDLCARGCPHCDAPAVQDFWPPARCRWNRLGIATLEHFILAGAKRVLLLGFDGGPDQKGFRHFDDDVPNGAFGEDAAILNCYRTLAGLAARHGTVIRNCTPGSAIDAFPKADLEAALVGRCAGRA